MTTPFGAPLVGETEKTLNALLHRFLEGTGLTESHWVTLRIAAALDGSVGATGLADAVATRAHFSDADELVAQLTERGLLGDKSVTPKGREVMASVQARIDAGTASIWGGLPADDVAAATRVLNEVVARARAALSSSPSSSLPLSSSPLSSPPLSL